MTMKTQRSNYYGEIVWREFAGIDFVNTVDLGTKGYWNWVDNFHPSKYFSALSFEPEKINATEEERIKHLRCVKFSTNFLSDNPDWFVKNKEFMKQPNTYVANGGREKTLPTAITDDYFQAWFAVSQPYINQNWKKENPEFMTFWSNKVNETYKEFTNACQNGDMKIIRKCMKLNVNFNENNGEPISKAIENNQLNVVKYLLNKDAEIPMDMFPVAESKNIEIHNALIEKWEKNQKKELAKNKKFKI